MKEAIKYLPINLIASLATFGSLLLLLSIMCGLSNKISIPIAFFYSLSEAINGSKTDYLKDRIDKLEEKANGKTK